MAVATRRALVLTTLFAGAAWAQTGAPSNAEGLRVLYGLAELQRRASTLAASRDTRPEVKSFATDMAAWREMQVPRLRDFLTGRGIAAPEMSEDQRAVWEALEPLDFLALSRRFAEIEVQALELEIAGYERATTTGDQSLVGLANEALPSLRRLLDSARRAYDAVKP